MEKQLDRHFDGAQFHGINKGLKKYFFKKKQCKISLGIGCGIHVIHTFVKTSYDLIFNIVQMYLRAAILKFYRYMYSIHIVRTV